MWSQKIWYTLRCKSRVMTGYPNITSRYSSRYPFSSENHRYEAQFFQKTDGTLFSEKRLKITLPWKNTRGYVGAGVYLNLCSDATFPYYMLELLIHFFNLLIILLINWLTVSNLKIVNTVIKKQPKNMVEHGTGAFFCFILFFADNITFNQFIWFSIHSIKTHHNPVY